MAEIKREPVKIIKGGVEYDAFDEDHTISDLLRYAVAQGGPGGREEAECLLRLILAE